MLKRLALGVLVAGFVLSSGTASAQVSREELEAFKAEIELLREAVKSHGEVLRQLLERTGSLRDNREPPFQEVLVKIDGAPFDGKSNAKVTIVEFSDYQCPFCARYAHETSIHPQAFKAHEAVHCAQEQGKRREMHEKVFSNQRAVSGADLTAYAQALGLDGAGFEKCLAGGLQSVKIRRGLAEGQESDVRGTPTFLLGLTESDSSKVKAVRRIVGAQPYSVFKAAIEELLSSR